MDLKTISQIVLAFIASIGGAGAIVIFVGKWLANLSAEAILKKTEFKFSEELEDFKSKLEKKTYISKTRFDLEIDIYKRLTETVLKMVFDTLELFPPWIEHRRKDMDEEKNRLEQCYSVARDSYIKANVSIMQSASFIPKNTYELFTNIRDKCRAQISWFPEFRLSVHNDENIRELKDEYRDCWKRSNELKQELDDLLEKLRNHIAELDVIE